MAKEKPVNPYQRLLKEVKQWAFKAKHRHVVSMFMYPKARLAEGWSMVDAYERTKAAEQLGYDVRLVAADDGLRVQYIKRVPDLPYEWQD